MLDHLWRSNPARSPRTGTHRRLRPADRSRSDGDDERTVPVTGSGLSTRPGERIRAREGATSRRRGLTESTREADRHVVRDRFANLIRETRKRTGKTLHVGSTVTVTERNHRDIPDVVRRILDNADSFRILSFLPAAEVGRTLDPRIQHLTMDEVWEQICDGIGVKLNRHAM